MIRLRPSVTVRPAAGRVGRPELEGRLAALGADGSVARDLDAEVDRVRPPVTSLSPLSAPLALSYLDRLAGPIPALTAEAGVVITGRAYVAHLVVEADPGRFGAPDVPVLGTLPGLRKGRVPQDLLSRVVKASRGDGFWSVCAVSRGAWDGFVHCTAKRAHDLAGRREDHLAVEVVDGLSRFAWVLRQADLHYGQEPERA